MLTIALQAMLALAPMTAAVDPICPSPCILVFETSKTWCSTGVPILDCMSWPLCNNCSTDCSPVTEPTAGPTDPLSGVCIEPNPVTELCSTYNSTYDAKRCSSLCYCTGVTVVGGVPCVQRTVTRTVACDIN